MLIGYMRVSKADGSQVLDLQHDALIAAGVEPAQFMKTSVAAPRMTGPAWRPVSGRCARMTCLLFGSSTG